jgi:hypothetical protein
LLAGARSSFYSGQFDDDVVIWRQFTVVFFFQLFFQTKINFIMLLRIHFVEKKILRKMQRLKGHLLDLFCVFLIKNSLKYAGLLFLPNFFYCSSIFFLVIMVLNFRFWAIV